MDEALNNLLQSFEKECQSMQDFLEESVPDDPHVLVDRLSMLNSLLARSGKLLADAKYVQDEERTTLFVEKKEFIYGCSATVASKFIESATADINRIVIWLDRINRSLVHVGENMRTQISFMKEEARITKTGY